MEKPLWAPWRMEFIKAPKPEGCIFCDFPAQTGPQVNRENLIAHRCGRAFTMLNRYPYNSGHVMVIPRSHASSLEQLSADDFADLHAELRLALAVLRELYNPEGFNVGMNLGRVAGAGIADHIHYHIVPRWGGDTNFMPVLSETKVINEHLEDAWERISQAFAGAGR